MDVLTFNYNKVSIKCCRFFFILWKCKDLTPILNANLNKKNQNQNKKLTSLINQLPTDKLWGAFKRTKRDLHCKYWPFSCYTWDKRRQCRQINFTALRVISIPFTKELLHKSQEYIFKYAKIVYQQKWIYY